MGKQLHLSDEGIISRAQLLSGDWNPSGDWIFNGSVSLSGGAHFPDNIKATFGNTVIAPDVSIYSDGTTGIVDGIVKFKEEIYLDEGPTEGMIFFGGDGTIELGRMGTDLVASMPGGGGTFGISSFDNLAVDVGVFIDLIADDHINIEGGSGEIYLANDTVFIGAQNGKIIEINWNGNNVDTRIEGDTDVNLFYLDASTDRVGIGTNLPDALFDVGGESRAEKFLSDVAIGTSPYACTSTTLNTNLNADMLDGKHSTDLVLVNGSQPLTANWDVGAFQITALNFISDVALGTQPYACLSTTLNTNLNADMLDGKHTGVIKRIEYRT